MTRGIVIILVSMLFVLPAWAEDEQAALETETQLLVGGPLFLSVGENPVEPTTAYFSGRLAQTLRLPKWTVVGLELDVTVPLQIGVGVLIDLVPNRAFRMSLYAGASWGIVGRQISVNRVTRVFDLTVGIQMSYRITKKIRINLDYRMYIPDPIRLPARMAQFYTIVIGEATKGGQLCLGVSYLW